ncbi:MAG: hypothetical protein Q7R31_04035 [Candidatus Levybacteria bacterium]|nr:hypothetical protein [Candidatus Levybacteria bacterium]
MAPEIEISRDQEIKVCQWIKAKGTEEWLYTAENDEIAMASIVDKEPLIIFPHYANEAKPMLYCSEKLASELAKDGIITLPKPQQKK